MIMKYQPEMIMKFRIILIVIMMTIAQMGVSQTSDLKTEIDGFQWSLDDAIIGGDLYFQASDRNGNVIIPYSRGYNGIIIYSPAEDGHEGYFQIERNGLEGACDKTGKVIVQPIYKSLQYGKNGFRGKNNGNYEDIGIKLPSCETNSNSSTSMRSYVNKEKTYKTLPNGARAVYIDNGDGTEDIEITTTCFSCNGTKICQACFGRGGKKIGYGADAIWYQCSVCIGKSICNKCKGNGEIKTVTRYNAKGQPIATLDEATGKMYYNTGYNSSNAYPDRPTKSIIDDRCGACQGTGICPICKGAGYTYNQLTSAYHPCGVCRPVGYCPACLGRGK